MLFRTLSLLALTTACASHADLTEEAALHAELQRLSDEHSSGDLFADLSLAPLTELRRLQGRADPLDLNVRLDYGGPGLLPNVSVQLGLRQGETESFGLMDPRSLGEGASEHFELVLKSEFGWTWTSRRPAAGVTHIGLVDTLHFDPAPEASTPASAVPIPLPWTGMNVPPPPGLYSLTVRYYPFGRGAAHRRPEGLVISSGPVPLHVEPEHDVPMLAELTQLRRSQDRPDPLELEVRATEHPASGFPRVRIRLHHRPGEAELFSLLWIEASCPTNYQLVLIDEFNVTRTSVVERHRLGTSFGAGPGLTFRPGYVWADTGEFRQGVLPPTFQPSAQPGDWFLLEGHQFPEPPPPGSHTLIVRFQEEGSSVAIESQPVPINLKG